MNSHVATSITTAAVAFLLISSQITGAPAQPQQPRPTRSVAETRRIHEAAFQAPFDEQVFRQYLETLPRAGDYYVIEGDIRATREEIRSYLVSRGQAGQRANGQTELLVSVRNGELEYYRDTPSRRLTYTIDRTSFSNSQYEDVVQNMAAAARAWEQGCGNCGIDFVHLKEFDESPGTSKAWFTVKAEPLDEGVIAYAFFPRDPPERRVVSLDDRYFETPYDHVGVLRHELGHVLGYRHENAPGVAGCAMEDGEWHSLTEYDSRSVMHYMCDEQTGSFDLELTDVDRRGHRALYGSVATAGSGRPAGLANPDRLRSAAVWKAAIDQPLDPERRRRLLSTLPKYRDFYIVEGDLKLTEEELTRHLMAAQQAPTAAVATPDLTVSVIDGRPDFWADPGSRTLSYSVDRESFPTQQTYNVAVDSFESAAHSWESFCPECNITFNRRPPGGDPATFVLRFVDSGGAFLATAFFPRDTPARRVLEIDKSFFGGKGFDGVAVLRHQLGHVLGYQHEPIRGTAGCYNDDDEWRPLTSEEPGSVMHYFCGPADASRLKVSTLDTAGHRRLYGRASSSESTPASRSAALVVRFEGGTVVSNAVDVMRILLRNKVLTLGKHAVQQSDNIELIYTNHLQLPAGKPLLEFESEISGKPSSRTLKLDDVVTYPQLTFTKYAVTEVVDPKGVEQKIANWGQLGARQQPNTATQSLVNLRYDGYELRIPIADIATLDKTLRAINALDSPNILATYSAANRAPKNEYFVSEWLHANSMGLGPKLEGDLRGIVDAPLSPPRDCEQCPGVILLDQPVDFHPDLDGAIAGSRRDPSGRSEPFLVDDKNQPANTATAFDKTKHHGTFMAGIIASRKNKFGLIGLNPLTQLQAWNWEALTSPDPTVLTDEIRDRQDETSEDGLQIYVMATDYDVPDPNLRTKNPFASILNQRRDRLLLIAAAGQVAEGQQPLNINADTRKGPMNLGDQENVLVVTACAECGKRDRAKLIATANFSTTEFVHVAAPGERIPGPVPPASYIEQDGTSPATALVAGLGSLMARAYPKKYTSAVTLKNRLIVTSRPFRISSGDEGSHKRVVGGVIDGKTALLDPHVHHLIQTGGTRRMEILVKDLRWALSGFTVNRGLAHPDIKTGNILRIVREGDSFVFFMSSQDSTSVERVGPVTLHRSARDTDLLTYRPVKHPDDVRDPAFSTIKLADIEDLLLSRRVRWVQ